MRSNHRSDPRPGLVLVPGQEESGRDRRHLRGCAKRGRAYGKLSRSARMVEPPQIVRLMQSTVRTMIPGLFPAYVLHAPVFGAARLCGTEVCSEAAGRRVEPC